LGGKAVKKLLSPLSVGTALFFVSSQAEAQVTNGQIYACVNNGNGEMLLAQ
jgi:hypothetical protein